MKNDVGIISSMVPGNWICTVFTGFYRAMSFSGERTEDQKGATPFTVRYGKDLIGEAVFFDQQDLFSGPDLVFSIQLPSVLGVEAARSPVKKDLAKAMCFTAFQRWL